MKLFYTVRLPFALTVLTLLFLLLKVSLWIQILFLISTLTAWLFIVNQIIKEQNEHEKISERVAQLKNFGMELQEVVNKELALVQEDVIRVKGIVSDSISILQSGVGSIYEKTSASSGALPSDAMKPVAATHFSNQEDVSGDLSLVRSKLAVIFDNIGKITKDIEAFDSVSKKLMVNDTGQIDGFLKVNETEHDVRVLIDQVPQFSHSIYEHVSVLTAAIEDINQLEAINSDDFNAADTLKGTKEDQNEAKVVDPAIEIQSEMMDIMRALQFEDIVGQISERVAQHISDIRFTVDLLSHLHDSEFSDSFEEDVEIMKDKLVEIKRKLSSASAKKIAAQKNMDEGDIDLF
ncbi:MAG: hypothetical protein ACRBCI_10675 [Cellvibrionaceae bacterium]